MDRIWIIFVIVSCAASQPYCPDECVCHTGSSSSIAHCHGAFPHFSTFGFSVNHLDVYDSADMPEFALVSAYFLGENFKSLNSIRIHNTSLISVADKTFDSLPDLYDLDLSDNQLLYVFHRDAIAGAKELRILSLSGSMHLFATMSGPIMRSESLRELDLSRCAIVSLHKDAFSLIPELTYLNLAENKISSIPPGIFSTLLSLQVLDLSRNMLSSLPDNMLVSNYELSVLNLRGNPISSLPEDIFGDNETSLIELNLSGTNLTDLDVPPATSLNYLLLNGSQINSVDKLSMFSSLKHLNLSETKLTSLEANAFAGNLYLETIRLSGNPNLVLPPRFDGVFTPLYLMDLSNCGFSELSDELFVHMAHIATLYLSHNAFSNSENLGKSLRYLTSLRVLDLSFNKLRDIKDGDFEENRGLTSLILRGNPLVSPPSLNNFPTLQRLDLSNCMLGHLHLPFIFREGSKLRFISLRGNNLVSLFDESRLNPEEEDPIWNPPRHLSVLDLTENPWSCEPAFTSLLYKLIRLGVAPSLSAPSEMVESGFPRDLDAEWRNLEIAACEDPTYEIDVMVVTDEPMVEPSSMFGAQFTIWLLMGLLFVVMVVGTLFICKMFGCKMEKMPARLVKAPIPAEAMKVNVSIVTPSAAAKKVRVKDYQRLHEDRSPGSPLTPRIYRPPPGTQFPYPELDKIPDANEDCEDDYTMENEIPTKVVP